MASCAAVDGEVGTKGKEVMSDSELRRKIDNFSPRTLIESFKYLILPEKLFEILNKIYTFEHKANSAYIHYSKKIRKEDRLHYRIFGSSIANLIVDNPLESDIDIMINSG